MVNWVPVVILVVAILVDKILQNGLVFFPVSLKVLAACLSLSPTTSSTFPAAQTFPPRLFRPLSRKGRTKDRVKSCLRESHPMPGPPLFVEKENCFPGLNHWALVVTGFDIRMLIEIM